MTLEIIALIITIIGILLSLIFSAFSKEFRRILKKWFIIVGVIKNPELIQILPDQDTLKELNWENPEIVKLTEGKNIKLNHIDSAIITYFCVGKNQDFLSNEDNIIFDCKNDCYDEKLSPELYDIYKIFEKEHIGQENYIRYCVTKMESYTDDNVGLKIEAYPISFFAAYPIRRLITPISYNPIVYSEFGKKIRDKYYSSLQFRNEPLQPNMLIFHLFIVTKDKQVLLLFRRRTGLAYYDNRWSASLEEHLNAPFHYCQATGKYVTPKNPNEIDYTIISGLNRTVQEELELNQDEIRLTKFLIFSVGFEYENFNTAIYVMAEIPITMSELKNRPRLLVEHDAIAWCPLTFEAFKSALIKNQAPEGIMSDMKITTEGWLWHPTSRMRIFLAMRQIHGMSNLMNMIRNEIKNN